MKKTIALLVLLFFASPLFAAVTQHTHIWTNAFIIGDLFKNSPWKYYLEPRLRFIDDEYRFEETGSYYGLGYQISPSVTIFGGGAYFVNRTTQGVYNHQNRVWQQISWDTFENCHFKIDSRTRLEERKLTDNPLWAILLREQLRLRVPFKKWKHHSFVVFDEVFFNLKHPSWQADNNFIEQNRIFLGLGTTLSQTTSFDFGYMSRYLWSYPVHKLDHIIYLSFSIQPKS